MTEKGRDARGYRASRIVSVEEVSQNQIVRSLPNRKIAGTRRAWYHFPPSGCEGDLHPQVSNMHGVQESAAPLRRALFLRKPFFLTGRDTRPLLHRAQLGRTLSAWSPGYRLSPRTSRADYVQESQRDDAKLDVCASCQRRGGRIGRQDEAEDVFQFTVKACQSCKRGVRLMDVRRIRSRDPFVALDGKEAGTRAAKSDAEVFPAVEVAIGSMPTLAEQTWILIASLPIGHVDILVQASTISV